MNLIENLHITTQRNKAPKNALCFTKKDIQIIDKALLDFYWKTENFKKYTILDCMETANYLKEWRLSLKYSRFMFVWFDKD